MAILRFVAAFVPGRQGITEDMAQSWLAEMEALGDRGEFFFASTQFCFTARRPPAGGS